MKWIGKHPVFSDLLIGGVLLTPPDNQYSYELTLPNDDGTAGQVLTTDGNGVLTWVTNSAGGTGVSMTNGVDNRVMTATAAQDITGESNLTFDSETLTIGADDDGEAIVRRTVHSDDDGGDLIIRAGNATGTDKEGGKLKLQAGLGTGAGNTTTGGDIEFYTAWPGSTGSSQQSGHIYPMFEFQSPTSSRNDFIIYQPGASQSDYFTIRTSTHGATDIRTVDSAAAAANLQFNIDGTFEVASTGIDISASGVITNAEWQGTDVAIAHGGTGQSTAQAAIDALSQVSGASAGEALIKDGSGNATWAAQTNTTYSAATSSTLGLLKIEDDTEQSVAANTVTATASRTYGIQFNSSDQAVVNVPWTDTNTTYTAGDGLDLSGTEFSTDLKSNGGLVIESTELAVDLGASSITGTLAVDDGGTGLTTVGANEILTGNGTSALTSESELRYFNDQLTLGSGSDSNTDYIKRSAGGSDIAGGPLSIHGGDTRPGVANNKNGGDLNLIGGLSTGTGASGKINIYTGWETVSGTGQLGPAAVSTFAGAAAANYFTIYEPNLATTDYFRATVVAGGGTTLSTYDGSGSQAGSLLLDADGLIDLDSARNGLIRFMIAGTQYGQLDAQSSLSSFTLYEAAGASAVDFFKIATTTHGATTISTTDTAGHAADLTLDIDGDITIDSGDGIINFDADGVDVARFDTALGNNFTVYGNTGGSGKIKLYEDTDNGSNHIQIQPPVSIASDKVIALPDTEGTVQLQGENTGQVVHVQIKDFGSYLFYLFYDDSWYSAGSTTLAVLGSSTAPGDLSSGNSKYQGRIASYTAPSACTLKKLCFSFYWSSSSVNAADFDFGFSKFTPIANGVAASITMNAITATDNNGAHTENAPYYHTFTFSGGNASLSAGDSFAFHMRTTGATTSQQRLLVYGQATLYLELD